MPVIQRLFAFTMPLLAALSAGGLSGCWVNSAPPGVVTGTVTYAGQPAAGKRVTLVGGESKAAATDASGRYTFKNVAPRKYQITYDGIGDREKVDTVKVEPNEVATWRSASFDHVDGAGKEVPPIEVAYNGLLYPEGGMALLVTAEAVLPFHWSTHPRAQRYRVTVNGESGFKWSSQWVGEPTAIFAQQVSPGRYNWTVEIDGGESGTGITRPRQVDL